jgi:DNA ligase-1
MESLQFKTLVEFLEKLESTTKRLEITDYLVDLIKIIPKDDLPKVVYLIQGKIYPDYQGIELGIAEKLAIKAIAAASTSRSESDVEEDFKKTGDLGETAANILSKRTRPAQLTLFQEPLLTVTTVYEAFDKIARSSGSGSIDLKKNLLFSLLNNASPNEAKYIIRMALGKLRLGVADMTILDALAVAYGGGKEAREDLERAYNLSSDLGLVAKIVSTEGLEGIKKSRITVGRPIRPMLCERLSSAQEILEKLGGKCAAEYKYDGERLQAHKKNKIVTLFSRRLENITHHYPDACELIRNHITANEAVVECECVAMNLDTGEMMPFQELMHRRRKYDVEEAMKSYPVSLFLFDSLYVDGEDLTLKPYLERRRKLISIVKEADRVKVANAIITGDINELEKFFEEAVADGCEGLVTKSIAPDSIYQAGARGWLWIKFKRDYQALITDTVDLVIVGAFYGRGRRAGTYGALLLAAYDDEKDEFKTVCKCGSGFTDEDLEKLPKMLKEYEIKHKHGRVDSKLEADAWFTPSIVLEVLGAEITLSPIHTCGMDSIRAGSGLAIRFPRFTGKYRSDKSPEDATTVKEIIEIYQSQLKKIPTSPKEAQV